MVCRPLEYPPSFRGMETARATTEISSHRGHYFLKSADERCNLMRPQLHTRRVLYIWAEVQAGLKGLN